METGLLVLWCNAVDEGRAFVVSLVLVWISGLVLSTCDRGHSLARELWFMSLSNSLRAFLTVEWFHCSGGRSSSLGQLWRQRGMGGGGGEKPWEKRGSRGRGMGDAGMHEKRVDIVKIQIHSSHLEINKVLGHKSTYMIQSENNHHKMRKEGSCGCSLDGWSCSMNVQALLLHLGQSCDHLDLKSGPTCWRLTRHLDAG